MRGKERSINRVGRIFGLTVMAIGLLTVASGLGDMAKSKLVGAPVFVFFTRGGFTGPYRIDAEARALDHRESPFTLAIDCPLNGGTIS